MKTEYIKPQNNKKESMYILISILILISISILLINFTKSREEIVTTSEKEISSFESFSPEENGIYSDLYNFSTNLEFFAVENGYPTIDALEDENTYPFVKDDLWGKRGKISWELIKSDKHTYYLGKSNDKSIGNFLLDSKIENGEVENVIKYYKGELIGSDIEDISNKFLKVKSLTGEDLNKGE
ncbi:hypothetical protein STFE110948_02635 [Streptobacillus felis]|uniref:Uncharacterized protein n=1 Tax=Streptobacillus felis TaxID=1384509 RepID=A0A7Z0TBU1_9FUSO|nr:hypothetical protein [Streptobacillus felis]NYV27728.1 hypothetical protein [Streptobacillus felis]